MCHTALVVGAENGWIVQAKLFVGCHAGILYVSSILYRNLCEGSHEKYGTTEEEMAMVSVKNHKNAALKIHALFWERG